MFGRTYCFHLQDRTWKLGNCELVIIIQRTAVIIYTIYFVAVLKEYVESVLIFM
jgi:hypothetical protein